MKNLFTLFTIICISFTITCAYAHSSKNQPYTNKNSVCGPKVAGRGCCSHHGGACGCSGGRQKCCDGTFSPSCRCLKSDIKEGYKS